MSERVPLNEAIYNIRRTCEDARRSPFIFIIGAGVSAPSIKLSTEITLECAEKYAEERQRDPSLKAPSMAPGPGLEPYSHFFELAYPEKEGRAEYLERLIHGKPISGATMRFAHLLASRRISQLVVTPNFDDLLTRALNLFGERPIVCDHPYTAARIDVERSDVIQIVHVHGTYSFYDCCNLKDEIVARAQRNMPDSMPKFIDQAFARRSPIVVGYSGWEDDVIMGGLKRRLGGQLRYHIYWFCYSAESYTALPPWLKQSSQIRFIVPDEGAKESLLRAQEVFDAFNTAFQLREPELTANPLRFFARRLRKEAALAKVATTHNADGDRALDLYDFASVIDKLERASKLVRREISGAEKFIEGLRKALRRSDYDGVVSLAVSLPESDLAELEPPQLESFLLTLESAAAELEALKSSTEVNARYVIVSASKLLNQRQPSERASVHLGSALIRLGRALRGQQRLGEAENSFLAVIDVCTADESPEFEPLVAEARYTIGLFFTTHDQAAKAVEQFEQVVQRYAASGRDETLLFVAASWRQWIRHDLARGYTALGIKRFGQFAAWLEELTRAELQLELALAFRDIIQSLNSAERYADAIVFSRRWRKRLLTHEDPRIDAAISGALVQYAFAGLQVAKVRFALCAARLVIIKWDKVKADSPETDLATAYEISVACFMSLGKRQQARHLFAHAFRALESYESDGVLAIRFRMLRLVAAG
jgi:SIR2-like domain